MNKQIKEDYVMVVGPITKEILEGKHDNIFPPFERSTLSKSSWEEEVYSLLSTTKPLGKGFTVTATQAGIANKLIDFISTRFVSKEEHETEMVELLNSANRMQRVFRMNLKNKIEGMKTKHIDSSDQSGWGKRYTMWERERTIGFNYCIERILKLLK